MHQLISYTVYKLQQSNYLDFYNSKIIGLWLHNIDQNHTAKKLNERVGTFLSGKNNGILLWITITFASLGWGKFYDWNAVKDKEVHIILLL